MTILGVIENLHKDGVGYYRTIADLVRSSTPVEVAAQLGFETRAIERILWVWSRYHTKRLQNSARRYRLSIAQMDILASETNNLGMKNPRRQDALLEAIEATHQLSADNTRTTAREIVARYHEQAGGPARRKQTMKVQKLVDALGQRRSILQLRDDVMAQLEDALKPKARRLMTQQDDLTFSEAMAHALVETVVESTPTSQAKEQTRPYFLLALQGDYTYKDGYILTGRGARVPWQEAVNEQLAPTGYILVAVPDEQGVPQPVQLPVRARFADEHLRTIAQMENLVCAVKGCCEPAADCQFHHIVAYKNGGETTAQNIVALCRYHNGCNDDDWEQVVHGHVERCPETGRVGHRRKPGSALEFTEHPNARFGWRNFALEQFRS